MSPSFRVQSTRLFSRLKPYQNTIPSIQYRFYSAVKMASGQFPPPAVKQLVEEVASLLKERKETVSVAETAAGGLISAALLSVPGASSYFRGGLTLYTLESRMAYAGWTQADIRGYSGPTPDVVGGLCDHVRGTLKSTYTVGESGTAGPTGGTTSNRTPGYVALAVSSDKGTFKREMETGLEADRESNMIAFAQLALTLLKEVIQGEAKL